MDKGEDKSGCKVYIFKDIGRQREKSEKRKWIEENGGISSSTLMNFLKQGLAEGSENLFNASKTIRKPLFEDGGVATCKNVPSSSMPHPTCDNH